MGSVGHLSQQPATPLTPDSLKGEEGEEGEQEVTVYVKSGAQSERLGACPFCQRVLMILLIKANHGVLRFKVVPTSPIKTPRELQVLGLKHLPALIHGSEGFDSLDDIIQYVDTRFPGGGLTYLHPPADLATQNFFSRFCFFIKDVNADATRLDNALTALDAFLQRQHTHARTHTHAVEDPTPGEGAAPPSFLCGGSLTHLDCEVLPKIQHLRVACKALKNYEIPTKLKGFWRYLHAAYSHPVFAQTCPCDQEIILHWHDRPGITPKFSPKDHAHLAKDTPKYAFDVPVYASPITVVED